MTTEAPTTPTTAPNEAPAPSAATDLDAQLDAVLRESRTEAETSTEANSTESDAAPPSPPEAKQAKAEDAPTARFLRTKAAELTKIETELAAKRGELATSEKLHAEKLAKADRLDALLAAIKEDPAAAIEELVGEDIGDFSQRLSRHVLGHDPSAKKLSTVEKEIAELKAKLAEKDAAEAKRVEQEKQAAQAAVAEREVVGKYAAHVEAQPERWPTLQRIDNLELAQAASRYRLRMEALTGERPSWDDTNDALEQQAALQLTKQKAASPAAPAQAASKPASRTLSPESSTERGTMRELTLEEKLDAVLREARALQIVVAGCEVRAPVAKCRRDKNQAENSTVEPTERAPPWPIIPLSRFRSFSRRSLATSRRKT